MKLPLASIPVLVSQEDFFVYIHTLHIIITSRFSFLPLQVHIYACDVCSYLSDGDIVCNFSATWIICNRKEVFFLEWNNEMYDEIASTADVFTFTTS